MVRLVVGQNGRQGWRCDGTQGHLSRWGIRTIAQNTLYYGHNLDILRRHVDDESVALVYLHPSFNSQPTYNVLFAERNGSQAVSQCSRAFSVSILCSDT